MSSSQGAILGVVMFKLRAVSYFSVQSYFTQNQKTQARERRSRKRRDKRVRKPEK